MFLLRFAIRSVQKLFSILFWLAMLAVFALSVATLYPAIDGQYAWQLNLLSQFRFQYLWIQLAGLLLVLLFHPGGKLKTVELALLLVMLLPNAWFIAPYYIPAFPGTETENPADSRPVELVFLNLGNARPESVEAFLAAEKPDVVAFAEYTKKFNKRFSGDQELLKAYPHRVRTNLHLALYSNKPVQRYTVDRKIDDERFHVIWLKTVLQTGSASLNVWVTHSPNPSRSWRFKQHLFAFDELANEENYPNRLALCGDFNSTPWSLPFIKMVANSGLRDSQLGHGVQPSWPTFLPVPLIPIDHVLVSADIAVLNRRLGPDVGSDHLPVIVELGL